MQLPAAWCDAFRIAVGLDIARKYRKPMDVLDLLDFTDGVKAGRMVHERATQIAIQHGASALYYCCWNGAKDFNFHPDWPLSELEAMAGGAVHQLERSHDLDVVPDGAIILPIMPGVPGTEDQRGRAAASFMGWYRLLQAMHRTVDVVTFCEIEHGRGLRCKWVLLPSAEIASRKAMESLGRLRDSTRLIVAGEGPREDERGNRFANPLPFAMRIQDYGRIYAGTLKLDAAAGDTPPMVMWRKQTVEHDAILEQARNTVEGLLPLDAGNARLIGAPHTVTCVTKRGRGRIVVHLVNLDDSPAEGIAVSVPGLVGRNPGVICDGRRVEAELSSDRPESVRVPPFRMSCLLTASVRRARPTADPSK